MDIDELVSKGILRLREAVSNDVDFIVPFINQAYRGESSAKGWTTESDILGGQRLDNEMANEIINKQDCDILMLLLHIDKVTDDVSDNQKKFIDHAISLHDDKKQLFIIATVSPEQDGDSMHLNMLAIHPELQSYGIGKYMMNAVEKRTKDSNISKVVLTVISCRNELVSYYERRGYKMNGNKHRFPAYDNPRFGIPKRDDLELHEMEKFVK